MEGIEDRINKPNGKIEYVDEKGNAKPIDIAQIKAQFSKEKRKRIQRKEWKIKKMLRDYFGKEEIRGKYIIQKGDKTIINFSQNRFAMEFLDVLKEEVFIYSFGEKDDFNICMDGMIDDAPGYLKKWVKYGLEVLGIDDYKGSPTTIDNIVKLIRMETFVSDPENYRDLLSGYVSLENAVLYLMHPYPIPDLPRMESPILPISYNVVKELSSYLTPNEENGVYNDRIAKFLDALKKASEKVGNYNEDFRGYYIDNLSVDEEFEYLIGLIPFTYRLLIRYDPNATAPTWEKFLNFAVAPEDLRNLQKFMGYIFVIPNLFKKFLLIQGLTNTGKTTFLNVIKMIMGKLQVQIKPQDLEKSTYDFMYEDIVGKLVDVWDDIDAHTPIRDPEMIRKITSERPHMTIPRKFKKSIDVEVYMKLIFSANDLPEVLGNDKAFYDRLIFVRFINRPKKRDIHLQEKLLRELPGIFNWILKGRAMLFEDGGFEDRPTKEKRDLWDMLSMPIYSFGLDCLEFTNDANAYIEINTMLRAYQSYAIDYERKAKINNTRAFSRKFSEHFAKNGALKIAKKINGEKRTIYQYVRPKRNCIKYFEGGIFSLGSDEVEVSFSQDYRFGKNIYKEGQRARMDKETAQDLSNRGIVEILEGEQEDEEDDEVIRADMFYKKTEITQQEDEDHQEVLVKFLEDTKIAWINGNIIGTKGEIKRIPEEVAKILEKEGKVKIEVDYS